jgi:hypothetical protein
MTGLVGAPFFLAASIGTSFFAANPDITVARAITTAPIFVWELSLGIYLVVKGFKPTPATARIDLDA